MSDREDYESGRRPVELFADRVRRYLPGVQKSDLEIDYTGIMAGLKNASDFVITRDRQFSNCIQLVGIDSPGLTSSLAIARHAARLLLG